MKPPSPSNGYLGVHPPRKVFLGHDSPDEVLGVVRQELKPCLPAPNHGHLQRLFYFISLISSSLIVLYSALKIHLYRELQSYIYVGSFIFNLYINWYCTGLYFELLYRKESSASNCRKFFYVAQDIERMPALLVDIFHSFSTTDAGIATSFHFIC